MTEATPSPTLRIRAARVVDWEAIAALMSQPGIRSGTLRLPYSTPEQTRKWMEGLSEDNTVIVAERDGRIVGMAGLHRNKGRRHHSAVLGISVDDNHRGEGIGKTLLTSLIDAADNWLGISRIELTVFTDNEAAIALYHKTGFEPEGTHRAYALRNGVLADVLAMARIRA
ncbi:GNAT family N-acetyltransferase [Ensifer sp. NM-2]|uniref:GNAT family N-acetyltransferase n=1 Tax=unclassified Ensifer TaxID=2633371 RepID=UPI00071052DF|nr:MULTISPECIES: GNAT family N-acetyltransferase [unclassified Ensifer]KQW85111.1 GNAT family acetyltransferase [Ensifer sp. Root127]PSS66738.1 GNAT family N-acetyltransferase [Ensifer sp. NM-2]